MSKPYLHAQSSAKKWGGTPEDYLPIHDMMDSTKSVHADVRHRCVFHSAFGIFIIEKIFGTNIRNRECKLVSVRDIAEQHVLEDLGTIPSLCDWLRGMPVEAWMSRPQKITTEENIFDTKETIAPIETVPRLTPFLPFPPTLYPDTPFPPNRLTILD